MSSPVISLYLVVGLTVSLVCGQTPSKYMHTISLSLKLNPVTCMYTSSFIKSWHACTVIQYILKVIASGS